MEKKYGSTRLCLAQIGELRAATQARKVDEMEFEVESCCRAARPGGGLFRESLAPAKGQNM